MKSRLPARKERAQAARRLGEKFGEMSRDSAAAESVIEGGIVRVVSRSLMVLGATAGVSWWQGAEFTLGHLISIVAAVAGLAGEFWLRRRPSDPGAL